MRKRLLSLGLIMVLCFSLTGCKSSDYKKAVELQNSGDYAGALELFKGIGDDYKDVSDRATECQSFIDSITAFDEAKSLLDDKNAELDKAISEANDLVNGENTALDESLRSLLETKISETKAIKITAPTMAETVKEIDTQTTEMNTTDYSDALKSLNEAYTAFNNSVKQYELVNNPAESYVIKCLEKVEHVIGMCIWKQWKKPRTKARNLIKMGVPEDLAMQAGNTRRGHWFATHTVAINMAMTKEKLINSGFYDLATAYQSVHVNY